MTEAVRKPLSEVLDQALEKLVLISPNKKTFDELTSVMFQLYCGNDFGMGNASVQFLEKTEQCWKQGRKKIALKKGLSIVHNA
jgi:hypothetical protein